MPCLAPCCAVPPVPQWRVRVLAAWQLVVRALLTVEQAGLASIAAAPPLPDEQHGRVTEESEDELPLTR
jgi:hypothetical protein